jgi:hypothetical protein
MNYRSTRPLADLAEGLIRGCIEYCGDPIRIHRADLPGTPGTATRFVLFPDPSRTAAPHSGLKLDRSWSS